MPEETVPKEVLMPKEIRVKLRGTKSPLSKRRHSKGPFQRTIEILRGIATLEINSARGVT